METGEYYTLIRPIENYFNYKMGEKYLCVNGEEQVLTAEGNNGWVDNRYGDGRYYYVNYRLFRRYSTIILGGE